MSIRRRMQKEVRRKSLQYSAAFRVRVAGSPRLRRRVQGALKTLGMGLGYGVFIEPSLIEVTQVEIPIADLPPALDGYRIAHLSDIHYNITAGREFLRRVVARTQSLDPDLVALTGDFVTHKPSNMERCLSLLSDLRAPDGCWAVRGNHDYIAPLSDMRAACRAAGIQLLENEHRKIRPIRWRGGMCDAQRHSETHLIIAGVGDLWEGVCSLGAALESAPSDHPTILLAHNPQTAHLAQPNHRIDLQLSGHTHGGQIRFLGKPLKILSDGSLRYTGGLTEHRSTPIYVSRGVGTSALRFRWNCRPEIALIRLVRG